MTETITPKLAKEVSIAGITPGLRMISARGAFDFGATASSGEASNSAIFFVSGRTNETTAAVTRLIAAAASHGIVRLSALTSLPAKSGLKTVGPRIAPKTDPNSTYEMPRARRNGRYISPAAVRTRSADALEDPVRMKPTITAAVEPTWVPSAVTAQPVPPTMKPTMSTGLRP